MGGRGRDIWVIVTYALLLALSVILIVFGFQTPRPELLAAGVVSLVLVTALAPIAVGQVLRRGDQASATLAELIKQQSEFLRQIHEHTLLSDSAKRIAYRREERELLRRAIEEDIANEDWQAASVLVRDMAERYGYREEAEEFRQRIEEARAEVVQSRLDEELARFQRLLDNRDWSATYAEAARLQRLFPEERRVRGLEVTVRTAWQDHKHELERQFLDAADKGNAEQAMEILKELDQYLTEREAEPYQEVARGVISKARDNLGLQFKLAIQDRDWRTAVRVGETIIEEFPNTLMAREVREKIDVLRSRAGYMPASASVFEPQPAAAQALVEDPSPQNEA